MGAYSRGALIQGRHSLDIPVSRLGAFSKVGAYSRGHLIEALRYVFSYQVLLLAYGDFPRRHSIILANHII